MLGIDCFVKSGLKEFYVYNLGYNTLYPSIKWVFPVLGSLSNRQRPTGKRTTSHSRKRR